jgi:hypothetical protein
VLILYAIGHFLKSEILKPVSAFVYVGGRIVYKGWKLAKHMQQSGNPPPAQEGGYNQLRDQENDIQLENLQEQTETFITARQTTASL